MTVRPDRIWAIARKEFTEFRRNRYILYSLILMPLLMATILPALYMVPVVMFQEDPEKVPWNLSLDIVNTSAELEVRGAYVENIAFEGCKLVNVVAYGCTFRNCSFDDCTVSYSHLNGSIVQNSVVRHSNLIGTDRINTILVDSVVLGERTPAEATLDILIDTMLLFFMLIPAIVPTVVASYTFVGEKLNHSLEPLLATPTTDLELLLGKSASIFIPCVLITWIVFVPFVLIVNTITYPVLDSYPLPNAVFLMAVFLMAPLFCVLSILGNVLVSARVTDVRSAQQLGSLVVLPLVVFLIVSISGLATIDPWFMLAFSGIVLLVDLVMLYITMKAFRREEILIRWK